MWKESKSVYRHELKFLISKLDKEILEKKLAFLLSLDNHAPKGKYMIRSLYFDDDMESAYNDKLTGISLRKKFRIRFYDFHDKVIHLECKYKDGQYIYKDFISLSKNETEKILHNNTDFLKERNEELCHIFYDEIHRNGLSPAVIVDYDRIPYISPYGTVRITFDEHIRAGRKEADLFDGNIPVFEVLPENMLILEVKYTEYLPEAVKTVLDLNQGQQVAASKYVLCYEKQKEFLGI